MTRLLAFAVLAAGVVSASRADVPVAPPPREIRPDGTRDPAPAPEAAPKEDPLAIVERIIKNSKDVGDKLATSDTGTGTRDKQNKILKDIDALLNQDDPPPKSDMNMMDMKDTPDVMKDMMKDGMGGMSDMKDMKDKQDGMGGMKDMKDGMGGGMQDKKMGGGTGGMEQEPAGGTDDRPKDRRPRQGGDRKQEAQPKDPGKGAGGMNDKQQPMGGAQPKQPPKSPAGGKLPDPKDGKAPPSPLLPNDDDAAREAWGHLPDKLRQQAAQYYKQEFMPRYAELLKLYYSSLAEKKW